MKLKTVVAVLAATLLVPVLATVAAEPARADTCAASSASLWDTCSIRSQTATAVAEDVTYTSGGLSLGGLVCRPKAAGAHPIVVINHGGFDTTSDYSVAPTCGAFAAFGYIAIAPSYRPFATSADTFCKGEVDDVLGMLAVMKQHPDADPDRVVMKGWSHGACITLRAYQRGVDGLVGAAVLAPPTDFDGEWSFLNSSWNSNLCAVLWPVNVNCTYWGDLRTKVETSTGGVPSPTTQAQYDARSVDTDLAGLRGDVPLMIVQGLADNIVPPTLTCPTVAAANALSGGPDFAGYHFQSNGTTLTSAAATGCSGFTWNTATNPTTTGYPGDHYFFVVDAMPHVAFQWGAQPEYTVLDDMNQFLVAKVNAA